MKRLILLSLAVAFALPTTAHAQLIMTMSNGWSLSFSGNVNAFWVFTARDSGPLGRSVSNSSIRTGLLPAFANFDAKGKEAGLDIGVHFGFAPEIQNGGNAHDQFGTQIDMREVYLTVGSPKWGQILAGRELGLFSRQNILNDMTLFGVGAVGPGLEQAGGTTLGRIGYGYLYANFNAQVTYSSIGKKPFQFNVGLFQPSVIPGRYSVTSMPRLEAEVTLKPKMSGRTKLLVWGGVEWQTLKRSPAIDSSATAAGGTVGVRVDMSQLAVVASYYMGSGIGGTGIGGALVNSIDGFGFQSGAFANDGSGRKFDGGYLQATYTANKKTTAGVSWGYSREKFAGTGSTDASAGVVAQWSAFTGGIYHQWTKSTKLVAEYTREVNHRAFNQANVGVIAAGVMLFF